MVSTEDLFRTLSTHNLNFFTGVPDSAMKGLMSLLEAYDGNGLTHISAANEAEAIAIATGYHLATDQVAVAYMQNSGLGNAVNPLTSLCDPEVYSIPMLLMIGWRGKPGEKDEPQHVKMGKITLSMLDILEIPYADLPELTESVDAVVERAVRSAKQRSAPYALIVKRGIIEKFSGAQPHERNYELSREEAIGLIVKTLGNDYAIISTTGKTSRELWEARVAKSEQPCDFYTVGSMGCSSAIALGVALQKPEQRVLVLDGDGAAMMHMGNMATIGKYAPKNLLHIILDNGTYESTGGQPTVSDNVDFPAIGSACGYKKSVLVNTREELQSILCPELAKYEGPTLLVVNINTESRANLGRPQTSPVRNKVAFMQSLQPPG